MDWQLTCRICMETGEMVSLFDCDQNNQQFSEKYAYCCAVEVTEDDPLPKLICLDCVDRLTLAYDFKMQCISSNYTFKECLEEYVKSNTVESAENAQQSTEVETFTVKQENGMLLQYHVTNTSNPVQVVTVTPAPKRRGRPRKCFNQQRHVYISPPRKKLNPESGTTESYTTSPTPGFKEQDEESADENTIGHEDVDSEDNDLNSTEEVEMNSESEGQPEPKKRRKQPLAKKKQKYKEDEGQLTNNETLEPVPDQTLNPKSKNSVKKKYANAKTYVCETCHAAFSANQALQDHIRRHLGIKPFVCNLCGFASVLKLTLQRHMMKHTGARPYKCSVCGKTFSDRGSQQKHERIHTGERPYECKVCNKTFNYSYVLGRHMKTHTGEKKYSCDQCKKKFGWASALQRHIKLYHKELYQQQRLKAELKKSRQQVDVHGITAAFERAIRETGTDEGSEL